MLSSRLSDSEIISRAVEFICRNKNDALRNSKVWQTKNSGKRLVAEKFFDELNNVGKITGEIECLGVTRTTEGHVLIDTAQLHLLHCGVTVCILFIRFRHEKPINMSLFDTEKEHLPKERAA